MIKFLNFCFIFFVLLLEKLIKTFGVFKNNIASLNKKPSYYSLIKSFSENRTLRIINFFFHYKIFDCFVCCSLVKKIYFNNPNYKFLIGLKEGDNKKIKSHAWIVFKDSIFFAVIDDIENYKVILEIK